jgi:hypothetical protein
MYSPGHAKGRSTSSKIYHVEANQNRHNIRGMWQGKGYPIRRNSTDENSDMRDVGDAQNEEADRVSEVVVLVG